MNTSNNKQQNAVSSFVSRLIEKNQTSILQSLRKSKENLTNYRDVMRVRTYDENWRNILTLVNIFSPVFSFLTFIGSCVGLFALSYIAGFEGIINYLLITFAILISVTFAIFPELIKRDVGAKYFRFKFRDKRSSNSLLGAYIITCIFCMSTGAYGVYWSACQMTKPTGSTAKVEELRADYKTKIEAKERTIEANKKLITETQGKANTIKNNNYMNGLRSENEALRNEIAILRNERDQLIGDSKEVAAATLTDYQSQAKFYAYISCFFMLLVEKSLCFCIGYKQYHAYASLDECDILTTPQDAYRLLSPMELLQQSYATQLQAFQKRQLLALEGITVALEQQAGQPQVATATASPQQPVNTAGNQQQSIGFHRSASREPNTNNSSPKTDTSTTENKVISNVLENFQPLKFSQEKAQILNTIHGHNLPEKEVTLYAACRSLSSYKRKLRLSEGRADTNQARVMYWSTIIEAMQQQNKTTITVPPKLYEHKKNDFLTVYSKNENA